MRCPRLVLALLESAESCGVPEGVVGDILEEIERGCSRAWICRELCAVGRLALTAHIRDRARVTPRGVTMALSGVMLAAFSLMPVSHVLELWLVVYCLTGTVSLFAHMTAERLWPGARDLHVEASAER